ncbi:MAG: type II toxin-antitoxin system CcdA family antitoxin [Candidatus Baldrarchaeia archaeon]
MSNYSVVTGKVPKKLKEKAKQLGININKVIREALENAVREKEDQIFLESLNDAANILSKINIKRVIQNIREDKGEQMNYLLDANAL